MTGNDADARIFHFSLKQIYKRHSKALDLINNNKDKPNRVVAKYIRESLKRINKERR